MPKFVEFYTFSYNNPVRESKMRRRFAEQNLTINFVTPVEISDPRLNLAPEDYKRTWAIMWNHLDMVNQFLNSSAKFGIFCEDDIFLHKELAGRLPEVTASYQRLNLEILLLGYLIPYKPVSVELHNGTISLTQPLSYISYGEDLWGSQMYMLNRDTAEKFLSIYTQNYAEQSLKDTSLTPFSPDWTLTKNGRRAAIYPMLAVEEGTVVTSHQGQINFHAQCNKIHYDPEIYS